MEVLGFVFGMSGFTFALVGMSYGVIARSEVKALEEKLIEAGILASDVDSPGKRA